MSKYHALLIALFVFIPGLMLFMYTHMSLGRLLILREPLRRLRTWQPAQAAVTSVTRQGPAVFHNPWVVLYRFSVGGGKTQEGKYICTASEPPVREDEGVDLLYDPEHPSLCALKEELQSADILERGACRVKSEERIRTELAVNGLICLAFAVGSVFADIKWSYTRGAGVLYYLVMGSIFMGCGALQALPLRRKF